MVSDVLKRIHQAEAQAAEILQCAEEDSRQVEAKNYTAIQEVRDNVNVKINHAVKTLEDEILTGVSAAEPSIEIPAKPKTQKAKDFVVNYVLGGAS
jgi:hypothetical protein